MLAFPSVYALVQGIKWDVGTYTVNLPGDPVYSPPATPFDAKPRIDHVFRPADKRPSAILAFIFNFVVVAPFVLLIYVVVVNGGIGQTGGLKLDIKPSESVWAYLFVASIAGVVFLNFVYFVSLGLFEAVVFMLGLLVCCFVFGRAALGALQARGALKLEHVHTKEE